MILVWSFQAADAAGEKLAWWFGITKPKFLYEIEEFNRMKKEELEQEMRDDATEEIHIGANNRLLRTTANGRPIVDPSSIEMAVVVDERAPKTTDTAPEAANPPPSGMLQM